MAHGNAAELLDLTPRQRLLAVFRRSLKSEPYPLIAEGTSGHVCPGASLWTGSVEFAQRLGDLGVGEGCRVACHLPNGIEFVQLMLGAWRVGATFCPVPYGAPLESSRIEEVDPSLLVGIASTYERVPWSLRPDELLAGRPAELRQPRRLPTPEAALMLYTSGTSGHPRAVLLSPDNLRQQIESHRLELALAPGTPCVSYLSWAHAFGGVVELLTGLASGLEFRLPCPLKFDRAKVESALRANVGSAFFSVPKVLDGLDDATLATLGAGVVGGAALDAGLAKRLTDSVTRMRVGYGLTECSPGVMLGPPGVFRAGLIGAPVGCEVREVDGELHVRGPNVALSEWTSSPFDRPDGWLRTGDLAIQADDGLYEFRGRVNACWKWSNGRVFNPEAVEETLAAEGVRLVLLKAEGDEVQPVILGDPVGGVDLGPKLRSRPPVILGTEAVELCATPSGKLSRRRVAATVLHLFPQVSLDPAVHAIPGRALVVGKGAQLDFERLAAAARDPRLPIEVAAGAMEAVDRCHELAQRLADSGTPIYGWKTGFGPHVGSPARACPDDQGLGLIAHLQAGQGPLLPKEVVRGMLVLRLHTIAQGRSGVSPQCVRWLYSALASGLVPAVPSLGSVGASGDLVPMAHAVAAFLGEGEFLSGKDTAPAAATLAQRGHRAIPLQGRDALGLVNGTPLMAAAGALALDRAWTALAVAVELSAALYELLGANHQPLSTGLHAASNHEAHERIASAMRDALQGIDPEGSERPLQESYSVRCVPQLLGACLTTLRHARAVLNREIGGVSDNPVFDPESGKLAHGGNFFGQEVAFAMDALATVVVQMGNLAERQLWLLLEPSQTGLSLLLSPNPGEDSGLAGVQISATAIVAEMRRRCVPASIQSLPTNGLNQDVVPMGTHAAANALELATMLSTLQGSLALALRQAFHLAGRAPRSLGALSLWPALAAAEPITRDRPLAAEVRLMAERLEAHPALRAVRRALAA